MNFENPTASPSESEEGRLSLEKAQESANMMKTKLEMDEDGMINSEKEYREPTAEDYEAALQAVEEMEQLAEHEPAAEKMVMLMGRVAERTRDGAMVLLRTFAMPWGGSAKAEATHASIMERLTDASKKLKDLKDEAKKREKPEQE